MKGLFVVAIVCVCWFILLIRTLEKMVTIIRTFIRTLCPDYCPDCYPKSAYSFLRLFCKLSFALIMVTLTLFKGISSISAISE